VVKNICAIYGNGGFFTVFKKAQSCRIAAVINIVAYLLKARTVKPEETAVARERLCEQALC
jgi:hypothetical protein